MLEILNDLYNEYSQRVLFADNPTYSNLISKLQNERNSLENSLDHSQLHLLKKYFDCQDDLNSFYDRQFFYLGFSLANSLNKECTNILNNVQDE